MEVLTHGDTNAVLIKPLDRLGGLERSQCDLLSGRAASDDIFISLPFLFN